MENSNGLIDLAIEESQKWENTLGVKKIGRAEKAFLALKEGKLRIGSPQGSIIKISPLQLNNQEEFNYYIIPINVLLFPGRGTQYSMLECSIQYLETDKKNFELINVFPLSLWNPILEWGGEYELSVGNEFQWGIEVVDIQAEILKHKGKFGGQLESKNQLKGFLKILPYTHTLGRMEVVSVYTSDEANWRLDSNSSITKDGNTQFISLIKISKNNKKLKVRVYAQAKISVNWLTAQISHIYDRLSTPIRESISKNGKGFELRFHEEWNLSLPD